MNKLVTAYYSSSEDLLLYISDHVLNYINYLWIHSYSKFDFVYLLTHFLANLLKILFMPPTFKLIEQEL